MGQQEAKVLYLNASIKVQRTVGPRYSDIMRGTAQSSVLFTKPLTLNIISCCNWDHVPNQRVISRQRGVSDVS